MRVPGSDSDTIVALATPPGRGALSLIRATGPKVRELLKQVLSWQEEDAPPPNQSHLGVVLDRNGERLDQVVWTFYAGPRSYTGEDLLEISAHGSPVIAAGIVQACAEAGSRLAEPGEFTMRAFLNGKMDLVQAEAVRDLIAGQTRYQVEVARRQLEGSLSKSLQPAREALVDAVSQLETRLEFVEDETDPWSLQQLAIALSSVREELVRLAGSYAAGRLIRDGLTVVLAGRPNVGKSSIFNSLCNLDRALVTSVPGTTRDALREWIEIGGIPVCLVDTAGIRAVEDRLEMLGVDRSVREIGESDLVLFVLDGPEGYVEGDSQVWGNLNGRRYLVVVNKVDVGVGDEPPQELVAGSEGLINVSARTGENIPELVARIEAITRLAQEGEREPLFITNLRQKECLDRAAGYLDEAVEALGKGVSEEYVSYDVRQAMDALSDLLGETTTGDILNRIFSTFCIGK